MSGLVIYLVVGRISLTVGIVVLGRMYLDLRRKSEEEAADALAGRQGVNFSLTFQTALKQELNV